MIRVGDRFIGRVRDLSSDGNGVVEHESGQVFFVPGVWVDETGIFRVTGLKSRFGFACLEELQQTSPERLAPPCPHQGFGESDCGGCPWQFISYAAQLLAKKQRLLNLLQNSPARFNQTDCVKPILASDRIFGYRNRAQLKTDGSVLGFVSADSRTLAPVQDCLVLTEKNRQTLAQLQRKLPATDWRPVGKRNWNYIAIDEEVSAENIQVNRRRPFRQANDGQNTRMQHWLLEKLDTLPEKLKTGAAIELFCGSGNFTECMVAAGFTDILAVEAVEEALRKLEDKNLPGVTGLLQNLYQENALTAVLERRPGAKVVVLDPPREGLKNAEKLVPKNTRIEQLFYISCDPATFIRDCVAFIKRGFAFREIQPVDQFPHTPHIEILAHLQKVK